jgi:PAS domain S-box-containing protein
MEFLQHTEQFWGTIAGILTIGATIFGLLYKVIKKTYTSITNEIKDRTDMHEKVNVILSELTPNHGSSLKDKINIIGDGLLENTKVTKENAEMLKTLRARQQWLLDMQKQPIFESDETGSCIWVNDTYSTLISRCKEEILGNGWKNFVHEDDRERVVDEWNRAVKEERSSQFNYRMISKDGTIYNVECYASKHKNNGYTGRLTVK